MLGSERPRSEHPAADTVGQAVWRRGWSRRTVLVAALAPAAATVLASLAIAANLAPTLSSARNSTLSETITVDAHGRTLYALSPETIHHLLCRSSECFAIWRPLTVPSRAVRLRAGHGVQGHLALLRRSNGKLQVTLRGMPLYRFSGDTAKGEANGEGIKSFGGTWHAVPATASQGAAPMGTPTTPSTPAPGY